MLGELAVIAQANVGGLGVEQRDAAAWRLRRLRRPTRTAAPTIIRTGIRLSRGKLRVVA
jgi:hypothetical protein